LYKLNNNAENGEKKKLAQIVTAVYVASHSQLTAVFSEVWHGFDGNYDEYCLGCDTSEDSSYTFY
jgi:hypothetical protein